MNHFGCQFVNPVLLNFKSFQQAVLQNGRCISKVATYIRNQVVIQRGSLKTCTKLAKSEIF